MGLSKKNLGSIAGNSNEAARKARTSTNSSTGLQNAKKALPPLLAPCEIGLSSTPRGVEQTGGATASIVFPPLTDSAVQESGPILDEVIDGLDDAFDIACSTAPGTNLDPGALLANDETSIQELFCQIAATYSLPLKNFIFALQCHTASKNTIEFCRPILQSIRSAAETINLDEAVQQMEQFEAALAEGQSSPDLFLKGKIRKQILDEYGALAEVLPETFQIGEESRKREDIIIHSLLQEVPGVSLMTFKKLYRSGLGSLTMLLLANPEDLTAATGIQRKLCAKICDKVQQYHKETEQRASQTNQSGYHSRLVELVTRLRKLINSGKAGIRSGSTSPSSPQSRTRSRRRNESFQEVNVVLAELGELELIHRLQKASLKKRVQILSEYLAR